MISFRLFLMLLIITIQPVFSENGQEIRVGSKKFTESVILGEIVTGLISTVHQPVRHLRELGGTRVLWNALLKGEIDLYPEYTGTIIQEILADQPISQSADLRKALDPYHIGMSDPLGFNNTYALGMNSRLASDLKIETISDLRAYPQLRFGFTNEFMDRQDGWPSLRSRLWWRRLGLCVNSSLPAASGGARRPTGSSWPSWLWWSCNCCRCRRRYWAASPRTPRRCCRCGRPTRTRRRNWASGRRFH